MTFPLIDDPSHLERHADWNTLGMLMFLATVGAMVFFVIEMSQDSQEFRRTLRKMRHVFILVMLGMFLGYGITLALNNFRVPSYLQIRGGK